MAKKETLKARGIRFSDETWAKLTKDAEKQECFVSDVVRSIVDDHYENKSKGSKK